MDLVVYIVFGVLFFLLGILFIFYYKISSLRALRAFKEKQLKQFRENHPDKKHFRYENTGLYIPSWDRLKFNSPIFFSITSFIISVSLFIKIITNYS
ncbi:MULTISPECIES: hypothetical protein [unclassified Mycoplasma]|uniref:hypothetical protein n=1 Tax=unclassified Mycoplasma TaxID=2683645 RepID=UPI00211D0393|nr:MULTISPECIES: hypothetical protein [unclassified Mycoplasma]UUM20070.1 hypothetical protein NPA11_01430 [Mycoplasma sp. 1578d]UUM25050.1 hypothetical protein NPA12_01405 [Mycoplasma sp. 3686d]